MPAEEASDLPLEIGHVLFVDIVGYSKLLINEQSELLQHLKGMVRGSEQVRTADAAGNLIPLATGDGMALVFRNSPEAVEHLAVVVQLPGRLSYGQLKLHPFWDPLRGNPRFEKILADLAPKETK
ncbi:MAG: hypothetical protein H0W20_12665 [Chthoniobacterales bacterium]|nr:hypothetical protein [Chthoniobacterales bacterium]